MTGSNVKLGAQTLTIGGDNTSTTFSGLVLGTGSLIKTGAGTFTILGNNTYTGGTSFNAGILAVNSDTNLGLGTLSFNGGTLEALAAGGGITSAKAVTLNAGGGTFLADTGEHSKRWPLGAVIEPALKAAWEHEYKYSALPITAGFAAVPGPSATFFGPSEGHDSAVISAGITAQWTPTIATYVNYDGQVGRDRYDSNAVTGGVRITF